MRSLLTAAVAAILAMLAAAAPAAAAITSTRSGPAVAAAIGEQLPPGALVGASFTALPPQAECANGRDDDGDDDADLADAGCETGATDNREQDDPSPQCANGFDDDGDGTADFTAPPGETADPGCGSAQDDNEVDGQPDPTPQCGNGVDDDGDGRVDFAPPAGGAADPGCASATDLDEASEGDALPADVHPAALGDSSLGGFPTAGPGYAVLSTGDATIAGDPGATANQDNHGGAGTPGHGGLVFDLVTLRVDLTVPAGVNCLQSDLRFLSDEVPGIFNDALVVELDASTFSIEPDGSVTAPNGSAMSVNNVDFSEAEAAGTAYDRATRKVRASMPITPGGHSLLISVLDQQDAIVDSAALVDALRLVSAPAGACPERLWTPPAVTLAAPPDGIASNATPVYAGSAGDAPGDSSTVTVRVHEGASSSGAANQTLTTTRSGATWEVSGSPLAPGTYTARASQDVAGGGTSFSDARTFTVTAAPEGDGTVGGGGGATTAHQSQGEPPLPEPVTGKSVNVVPIRGRVTVRLPGGRLISLADGAQIPTGSVVDTRKGTIQLSSTGPGGTIQAAQFSEGLFRVTQTKGKRPVTELQLVERLARCLGGKQARSSRKRKSRRLWGDGTGSFRTRGRRSAATVSGTKWLVQDSCAGTLTRVARGVVRVRDFGRRKTVTVRAGQRYLAR